MKIILKKFRLFMLLVLSFKTFIHTKINVVPYYLLDFRQGYYISSRRGQGFSTVITNDLGVLLRLSDKHSLLGFYELNYTGPGLKRTEGEKFEFRYLTHMFVLQHNWLAFMDVTLKSRITFLSNLTRTGANEAWGFGLYDVNRYGISFILEKSKPGHFDKTSLKFDINYFEYPNYTDLLEEYLAGHEEATAGKQNNLMSTIGLSTEYKKNKISASFIYQRFINQNVIEKTGTYGKEKQQNIALLLNLQREQEIPYTPIILSPGISYKLRDSNQAYLHFVTFPATPTVLTDYYDYHRFTFSIPVCFYISKKILLKFTPDLEYTIYTVRPPRKEDNTFLIGEKQYNFLTVLSLAYIIKGEVTTTTFFYTYQTQSSNMKFERYFPYNYSGHSFGINLSFSY